VENTYLYPGGSDLCPGLWNLRGADLRSERIGATAMPKRVSFLFGSGISIHAGIPSVTDITTRVLSGSGVVRHTDGRYYLGLPDCGIMTGYVERCVEFLNILYSEIKKNYRSRPYYKSPPNYEDLYYVAFQIYESEVGAHDNPVVQPFVDRILPDIKPLLVRRQDDIEEKWQLYKIAEEATHYIHDIVTDVLRVESADVSYLNCIGDAYLETDIELDLFTLNHDTVLEKYLDKSRVAYTEGFESTENGYRYWSPEVFQQSIHKLRLFKLHGSLRWFRYESCAATSRNDPVGIAVDGRHWLRKDPKNGESPLRHYDRSVLLVGTFNKIPGYTNGIFADLFCEFRRSLRQTDILVVCGYGFGDRGINMQVADWAFSSNEVLIVVIHGKPEDLKDNAGPIIYKNWDRWISEGKMLLIERWIQDTSWKDVRDVFPR
jgi:hypothetical protein